MFIQSTCAVCEIAKVWSCDILLFDVHLSIVVVLPRPLTYTTEEFGRKWVGLTNEKKLKVDGSLVKKPSDFMDLVSKKLNFHPVQIIGINMVPWLQ